MNRRNSLFTGVIVASLALAGCSGGNGSDGSGDAGDGSPTTMGDVQQEMGEAMNEAGQLLQQKKNEFMVMLNNQSETFSEQMATLKARAEELEGDARQRIDETIASLETQTEAFRSRMNELKNTSGEAWEDMQAGLKSASEELEAAYQNAIDEFTDGS